MQKKSLSRVFVLLLLVLCLLNGCGKQGSGEPSSIPESSGMDSSNTISTSEPVISESVETTIPSESVTTAPSDTATQPSEVTYFVSVTNWVGIPMEKVRVKIYPDDSLINLVTMGNTDANGTFSFVSEPSDSYVAVLQNVPKGYGVDAVYPLEGEETVIKLGAVTLTEENMGSLKLSLGNPMPDFPITAPDGSEVMLYELLSEKKAVVLNFWNLDCVPCKMEFPYLQSAYEQFSEDVAVIALNPFDADAAITAFQQEKGYTFWMAQCDYRLETILSIPAHPTTVVIDRFGAITLIHTGSVPDEQPFVDMFSFFAGDDYQHTVIDDLDQLPGNTPA
ncbi:MAG: redoxin domain-containing protein [Oscillospiraceae bacterium]|nr:redoxin domain-containing protein [Oscillospiraceae bacterium]